MAYIKLELAEVQSTECKPVFNVFDLNKSTLLTVDTAKHKHVISKYAWVLKIWNTKNTLLIKLNWIDDMPNFIIHLKMA